MKLALFDLDGTLLPGDYDHAFGEYMVEIGWVDAATWRARNDAFYTAEESVTSQPRGERSSHTSSNFLKPGMLLAAIVFTRPAATRLLRMPRGPS